MHVVRTPNLLLPEQWYSAFDYVGGKQNQMADFDDFAPSG